jgi:hypothetical protein
MFKTESCQDPLSGRSSWFGHLKNGKDRTSHDWTVHTSRLLKSLTKSLSKSIQSWNSFYVSDRAFFDNVGTQGKLSVLAINKNFARLRELLEGPLQGLNELCDQGCKEEVSTKLLLGLDTSRIQALVPLTTRLTTYAARTSNETRTT